ncbi:hypothetical protein BVY04_04440 [bacterium M21]|nr:hypothetical protein BVY04_04440 [bacterium M21]
MRGILRNRKMIQFFFLFVIIGMTFYGLTRRNISNARTGKRTKAVTTLPVTFSLMTVLSHSALPEPVYIAAGSDLDAHADYFATQEHLLIPLFKESGLAVSIQGAWPEDPLYPYARRHNIRIYHIDAAGRLNVGNGQVSQLNDPTAEPAKLSPYVWHSFRGAIEMADVLASDLHRINPRRTRRIQRNLDRLRKQLSTSRDEIGKRYADLDDTRLVALTGDFIYLTDEMNVWVEAYAPPDINGTDLVALMQEHKVKLILAKAPMDPAIDAAVTAAGGAIVVLDPILSTEASDAEAYFRRLGENHAKLLEAFKNR